MKINVVVDNKREKQYECSKFVIASVGGTTMLEVKNGKDNLAVFKTFDYVERLDVGKNE